MIRGVINEGHFRVNVRQGERRGSAEGHALKGIVSLSILSEGACLSRASRTYHEFPESFSASLDFIGIGELPPS